MIEGLPMECSSIHSEQCLRSDLLTALQNFALIFNVYHLLASLNFSSSSSTSRWNRIKHRQDCVGQDGRYRLYKNGRSVRSHIGFLKSRSSVWVALAVAILVFTPTNPDRDTESLINPQRAIQFLKSTI